MARISTAPPSRITADQVKRTPEKPKRRRAIGVASAAAGRRTAQPSHGQGPRDGGGVDLRDPLRLLGQEGQLVVDHLGEAAVDEQRLVPLRRLHPQLAGAHLEEQGRAVVEDADLAVPGREGDEGGLGLQDRPLRSNHAAMKGAWHSFRHPFASFSAWAAASSMVPTYMKAWSGRWSHLPSHSS